MSGERQPILQTGKKQDKYKKYKAFGTPSLLVCFFAYTVKGQSRNLLVAKNCTLHTFVCVLEPVTHAQSSFRHVSLDGMVW